jgi:integrase
MSECIKCKKDVPQGAPFCPWCGTKQSERKQKKRTHGNGQGTVYHAGTSWRAEWTISNEIIIQDDGKVKIKRNRKTKSGFASKKAAQEFLNTALLQLSMPTEYKKKVKTVSDLFDDYKEAGMPSARKKGKIGKTKQSAYQIAYTKRIKPVLGSIPIDQVQINDLIKLAENLSYYQAKDCKDLLSVLYNRAIAEGYTQTNLTDFMTLPENQSDEVTPWTTQEIEKLWYAWGNGDRIAASNLVMVYTGMMPGELLSLKKSMISWEENQIIGAGMKTNERKQKPITFPDFIKPVLQDLCETSTSKMGYVLGMNKDNYYIAFREMKSQLGIREEVRPYSGRHSTHVSLAVKGVAPALIVKIMRQRNYKTSLSHYNQIEHDELLSALNTLKGEK